MSKDPIERVLEISRELATLRDVNACLGWDQETAMPPGGAEPRANGLAMIQGLHHERLVSKELGDLLEQLWAKKDSLSEENQANVRELRRHHLKAAKLPSDLVTELARTTSLAHHAWMDARKKSDFASFAPWLEKIFKLKRQEAEAIGYEKDPYDALIDAFEPSMTVAQLNPMFEQLRADLVPIVSAIAKADRRPDESLLSRRVPVDRQREFSFQVAQDMGFDTRNGILAVSVHPFCSTLGGPSDVRMTTRYQEDEPLSSFTGVMHETGHALYEQGLLVKNAGTPMGNSASLGIHESQSRSWENMVGRGMPFWKHYYPKLKKAWAPVYDDAKLDDFFFAVNLVKPTFIRVEADEVTYNLHIMVRYEIERDLFAGKLSVNDLPKVWNAKMQQYLGITPANDAEGVLQDVHWSAGLIGYFATYTLGNLYGAQLYDAARRAIPDLDERIERGDLKTLREWQRTNIHQHGSRWEPAELVKHVTGKTPDSALYIKYLNEKFGPLYGIHGTMAAR